MAQDPNEQQHERWRGTVLPTNVEAPQAQAPVRQPTWRATHSPWLVAALVIATFSLYALWWLGRTWWQLKQEDQDSGKRPVWHVLAMLVPIYGYFRFHAHMRTIAQLAANDEASSILNPLAMTVAWIVINLLSTASVMRGDVAIEVPLLVYGLCGALIGWAQYGLNSTWRSLPGGSVRARLNPLHIVLLFFGFVLLSVAVIVPNPPLPG